MKISPMMKVYGIRLEMSLEEALLLCQDPDRVERVRENIESVLQGSGVDPETGNPRPSALGLEADLSDKPRLAAPSGEFVCEICGKVAQTERGLKQHKTMVHKNDMHPE